jgi:integron integrase
MTLSRPRLGSPAGAGPTFQNLSSRERVPMLSERPRLLTQVRRAIRARQFSPRTETAYVSWIRRFIRFHGLHHPQEMGEAEVRQYIDHLANEGRVAASTQNQALAAILFLYRHVLGTEMPWLADIQRAKRPERLPIVLTREEVDAVLRQMSGVDWLQASILYGSGLRISECCALRVKDVDLDRREIRLRDGKGRKDRVTMLPEKTTVGLRTQLERSRLVHARDRREGLRVPVPDAFERKAPRQSSRRPWQWVFPASRVTADKRTGEMRRNHRNVSTLRKAVLSAANQAGITKRVTCHCLRHSFATHLLRSGTDIRTVQKLLGHENVNITMIYLHVIGRGGIGTKSPLDD